MLVVFTEFRKMKFFKKNGFTLIEVLVVVAITTVVTGVGFTMFSSYRRSQNLKLSTNEIVSAIRDTQKRSITQENGKQWGIRFENATTTHTFTSFSGSSYASGTIGQLYDLKRGIEFGNPPAGNIFDLIFSPITGTVSGKKVISLITGSGDGLVSDIVINSLGRVTTRLDTGLVGYWHFDEGTSTVAYDATGNENNGTLTNGPTWQTETNCRAGGCLDFDGSDDYIQGPFDNDNTYTISVWTKTTDSGFGGLAGFSNSTGDRNEIYMYGGTIRIFYKDFYKITSDVGVDDGNWHNIVGVYDGSTPAVYVDGVSVALGGETSASNAISSDIFRIGTILIDGSYKMDGIIDEVRIYNRVLSNTEILNIYNDLK